MADRKVSLAAEVSFIQFAFDEGDGRIEKIRGIASRVEALEEEVERLRASVPRTPNREEAPNA
jgi:hypothetical protein